MRIASDVSLLICAEEALGTNQNETSRLGRAWQVRSEKNGSKMQRGSHSIPAAAGVAGRKEGNMAHSARRAAKPSERILMQKPA